MFIFYEEENRSEDALNKLYIVQMLVSEPN